MPKIELIAPAGNWECARAAVANGADAIYFGMPRFNARMRADNFTAEDLPRLISYLHERGVRAFTTFNTLIFTSELPEAEKMLIELDRAGVDSVIVQDLGIAVLAQKLKLRVAVHASTQMTITSPEGIEFAKKLGIKRAVLARETSLRELAKFDPDELSLETFVHGALCVAYSGQCLTSESLGQRSANRGECAQACRLPYDMVVDGIVKDLGDRRYLLSPQDLAAVKEIPELLKLGVTGFKIEGRLKSPEYVAATTQVYRRAIDAALGKSKVEAPLDASDSAQQYKLEMVFSRGLYSGWYHGVNHQELVHARYGKKRGQFVGTVESVGRDHLAVSNFDGLKLGDGIAIDVGGNPDDEQGGRIYEIKGNRLYFKHGHIDFSKVKAGNKIWKTNDPKLEKELRKSFEKDPPVKPTLIDLQFSGKVGELLVAEASVGDSTVIVKSEIPLQLAQKRPLNEEIIRQQFGRLGETRYHLNQVVLKLEGPVIVPVSELNRMRREIVTKLDEKFQASPVDPLESRSLEPQLETILSSIREEKSRSEIPNAPELNVLCRSMDQIEAALALNVQRVYVDFEDIRRYKEAVELVRSHHGSKVFLATPRIQKAGEQGFFKLIEGAGPDGVLVRNLGAISYFKDSPLEKIGDFSLNVANPITAKFLMEQGLDRLTVSYDLNAQQVVDLLQATPSSWFELVVHQHMPMFHMEHCVFAAFLSNGTDHTNCGRPCDRHRLKLRDRVGVEHPVMADVGCRNTVYHAKAQSGVDFFKEFVRAGARRFRVELLDENKETSRRVIESYLGLIQKGSDGEVSELFENLQIVRQLGVTSGTLTVLSKS